MFTLWEPLVRRHDNELKSSAWKPPEWMDACKFLGSRIRATGLIPVEELRLSCEEKMSKSVGLLWTFAGAEVQGALWIMRMLSSRSWQWWTAARWRCHFKARVWFASGAAVGAVAGRWVSQCGVRSEMLATAHLTPDTQKLCRLLCIVFKCNLFIYRVVSALCLRFIAPNLN